jgi:hypothetical protein
VKVTVPRPGSVDPSAGGTATWVKVTFLSQTFSGTVMLRSLRNCE